MTPWGIEPTTFHLVQQQLPLAELLLNFHEFSPWNFLGGKKGIQIIKKYVN
jgi:hypothetical protein